MGGVERGAGGQDAVAVIIGGDEALGGFAHQGRGKVVSSSPYQTSKQAYRRQGIAHRAVPPTVRGNRGSEEGERVTFLNAPNSGGYVRAIR